MLQELVNNPIKGGLRGYVISNDALAPDLWTGDFACTQYTEKYNGDGVYLLKLKGKLEFYRCHSLDLIVVSQNCISTLSMLAPWEFNQVVRGQLIWSARCHFNTNKIR